MSARRLLFVADSLDVGGAERVLVGLAGSLTRRGHQVTIAASVGGSLVDEARRVGADVRVLGQQLVKRRVDLAFANGLRALLHQRPVDLVHTHMYASSIAAVLATLSSGPPVVVHEHSEAGWRGARERAICQWAYRRVGAVIGVSEQIRRRLLDVDRVPPDKVHVVRNSLPALTPPAAGAPLPRPAGPLVGVVARLQPEKGVQVFLRAAARLAARFPTAGFVVVGEGRQRAALERLAADLRVPVTFLGFRADAPALVAQLDLLVVPSFSEGTPLVVLEAMAAGVPLVATAVGGIPSQVRHEVHALLVPPGDEVALAEAGARLLGDRALATRLGAAARLRWRREFSGVAIPELVEGIYDSVLDSWTRRAALR
ncbi:glycosyltransferase [Goodfellowiella coeruleoviolacea]|uniref:Glycosyltransferase involved in cell wall bisynthesis n=1 Tax=Goodfellowiella coeruleoviolacea TaxID=334858 RepID=A0AAE3GBY1_9PSEU|nr:glycosyltransferase [Goodfellowiella coeruleoviolacea]MCP2164264.1 Glycosyltransferase involved in cell wall bisynthesis [Goodfellowiella coeruleoviolacea]